MAGDKNRKEKKSPSLTAQDSPKKNASPVKQPSNEEKPEKETLTQIATSKEKDPVVSKIARRTADKMYWRAAFNIVTLISVLLRLWKIYHPAEVVFDEVHFGKFASQYLQRTYFFDVHPPLGKLLFAAVGWLIGYDGHFLFNEIGNDYVKNKVPYIALRSLPALAGAAVVPICFLTMKEMGVSLAGCVFGALLLAIDNAMIAQSRLILLDSMLLCFSVWTIYCWVKFYKTRFRPFGFQWWLWLSLTGVGLAMTTSVKLVGLFGVFATVGIAVLVELWDMIGVKRGYPLSYIGKHFFARALCLIALPVALYLSFFYIHFAVLTKSGPGDAFMSPAFQMELIGNSLAEKSVYVFYGSNITMKSKKLSSFLHSHPDKYPLRYESGRVSTEGQQVTGYPHNDTNNFWTLEPVDPKLYPSAPKFEPKGEELEKNLRYLRSGDYVRLKHVPTQSYLLTHDVASPLTATNMEVTTSTKPEKFNDTIWKIEADGGGTEKIMSHRNLIRIISVPHKVAIYCNKDTLPEWGFGQNEINGNKAIEKKENLWSIVHVHHPAISKGNIGFLNSDDEKLAKPEGLMLHHNNALTKPHPYGSTPITWPFVVRGIAFWSKKEGMHQIYLLGNPLIWWASITGTLLYAVLWVLDRILVQRGIDDFGVPVRRWWDRSVGFLFLAWACHYLPFFFMHRMLFLHHYLPSFIFSTMVATMVLEFLGRVSIESTVGSGQTLKEDLPLAVWLRSRTSVFYNAFLAILMAVFTGIFYFFAPIVYGDPLSTTEAVSARKWLKTWDFQYAK